jgi:hypothetical protein
MRKQSNKNALIHGVYSSDIVLPWERAEDFNELLNGIRLDFMPNGTTEDDVVFEIAVLHWKKRRFNRALQLAFLQSTLAAEIEKSGKRSVTGIHRFLKAQRLEQGQFPAAVVSLSEAMTDLTSFAKSKKKPSMGKLGANLRSVINDIEAMQPHIEAEAKSQADEKPQAQEKVSDSAYSLDTIGQAYEMEERLDALIEKKIKRLIIIREFQRQYGQDSSVKLIEHRASTAKDVSSTPTVTKSTVTKAGRMARTKKSKGANDNWNEDGDNNNDDYYSSDNNDAEYDELEYEELQAKKKARQERRARKG